MIALYNKLSLYEADHGVCLAYGTMYGNTEKAALALAEAIRSRGIQCAVHDLTTENYSFALRDVFNYDTLILGSPTYNNGIFPPVRQLMEAVVDRMVKGRKFIAFGSFTWAAASVKSLNELATAPDSRFSARECHLNKVIQMTNSTLQASLHLYSPFVTQFILC